MEKRSNLEVVERDAVGDDLRGEEDDAGDDEEQAVERRAALEQGGPGRKKDNFIFNEGLTSNTFSD